jgi:glycosyltransferase involved in cell wall biosynthesis
MRKILFIAHYFPPLGGGGVQRSVKFVKHLPALGLLPVVVTGNHHSKDFWSPHDSSLMDNISDEVPIFRASWEPHDLPLNVGSKFGGPRLQALFDAGEVAVQKHKPELLYVSLSPYEDAYVAAKLAEKYRLPWVADLRDPWALDEFQVYHTRWHRLRRHQQMQQALRTAALIIMNTPEAATRFSAAFPALSQTPVVSLPNGFDAEDFEGPAPGRDADQFTIVHSGYLHTKGGLHQETHPWQYRILGRTETGVKHLSRSHYYLLRALEQWHGEDPNMAKRLRLVLVGAQTSCDRDLLSGSSVSALVKSTGYLPHEKSVGWIRRADLLFLPMHTLPPGRRATIVPGKTYEYLATERPILAAIPPGDARDIIEGSGTGVVCEPSDVRQMLSLLRGQYEAWRTQKADATSNRTFVNQFERKVLTECLAGHIHRLLSRAPLTPATHTQTIAGSALASHDSALQN